MIKTKDLSRRKDSDGAVRDRKIEGEINKGRGVPIDLSVKEIFHEMRNLLTIVKSNAQFCLKYGAGNRDLKDSLRAIIDNINFANKFIEDVLSLARIRLRPKLIR